MKLGFIGAGNMAEAIISGIISAKAVKPADILVSDINKKRTTYLKGKFGVKTAAGNKDLIAGASAVIIAVKPKDIDAALKDLRENITKNTLVISIAAAISTSYIERGLANKNAVIRVMPNTPALVLSGVSALCKGKYAGERDLRFAKKLLGSVGKVIEVKEKLMDIVTAISGSGPAYVFLFLEGLVEAGIKYGLSKEVAETLANNTVFGAAKMVLETKETPGELRRRVTSPGGTTLEALAVFEKQQFKKIIDSAVKACREKSKLLTK
ncbi:MAG: pyrroline-5-carboxylate reductase [Candidatus Firestonebacteria bacterium]